MITSPSEKVSSTLTVSRLREFAIRNALVGTVLLAAVYFAISNARFATLANFESILINVAPFAFIAIGQTLVILTGGIDLSVGSVISLSAMTAAWFTKFGGLPLWQAFSIAILVGLFVGMLNGIMVAVFNITPFVATLATLTAGSGMAYAIGKGAPITGLPAGYGDLANTRVLGLPLPVWLMIIAIMLTAVLLYHTSLGTKIYAVGGNPVAAEIAGIRVKRVQIFVYSASGLLAGISGVLFSSRVTSAGPTIGATMELDSIAAVVIGGASLFGGRGGIWGTVVGLLLIQTLNNGLDIMFVPTYWQDVIKGVLIAVAVGVDVYSTRRLSSQ